jgi:hypothetical protein
VGWGCGLAHANIWQTLKKMWMEKSMVDSNFMVQDIISTLLGFLIFPLILIIPGYVFGWALDLFDFRARFLHSRLAISLIVSVAVSPVLFYLVSSVFSFIVVFIVIGLFALLFIAILVSDRPKIPTFQNKYMKWVIAGAAVWFVVALFSLVDIQSGKELYFSVVAYDQTTRISIVDAMTRTGVPPVNPSYYPGHPVQMNFLYFFWYILASIVDQIGGKFVDARGAFFASGIWGGLALMSAIGVFIRLRKKSDENIWKAVLIGIGLLTVSGLDFLPASIAMRYVEGAVGDIEHWNEQITAWAGSLLWVPHHIAAVVAGLVAALLVLSAQGQSRPRHYALMALAGTAFASAFGLSVWVTFVFVLFWGVWILLQLLKSKDKAIVFPMIFAGVVALLLSAKFLAGIFAGFGGSGSGGGFPVTIDVRSFSFVDVATENSPKILQTLLRLMFLPLNYFFELGFYFLVAFIWLRGNKRELSDPQTMMEVALFGSAFFIGTFMRSTLIENNDLGWRAWLPAQFILLIWGVDILVEFSNTTSPRFVLSQRTRVNLLLLLLFGFVTTVMDVVLLRGAYYFAYGPEIGGEIYSARQAYAAVNQTLPLDAIVQYNPASIVNKPSGLYGMRQSAISDRSAYGVPQDVYLAKVSEVRKIFDLQNVQDWHPIDELCKLHYIDVLVVVDNDKLWTSLPALKAERSPVYMDNHFAVFTCGNYAASSTP